MRYTKAKKAEQEQFAEKMQSFLVSLGAKIEPDLYLGYKMVLETKAGPLFMTLYKGTDADSIGWVAGRFKDIKKASEILGSDSCYGVGCSGKWNHHFFNPNTVQHTLDWMEFMLNKVLLEKEP